MNKQELKECNAAMTIAKALNLTSFHGAASEGPQNLKTAILNEFGGETSEAMTRTGDTIVYTGTIYRKSGAFIDAAGFKPEDADVQGEPHDRAAIVVNIEKARMAALLKLDALDKLVLGLN